MRYILAASLAFICATTASSNADESSDTTSGYDKFTGLRGSLAFAGTISGHDNLSPPDTVKASSKVGAGGSVYWGSRLPYGFKAELELLYRYQPLSGITVNGVSGSISGSTKVFAPMANLYWNVPIGMDYFHPFIGGGVGYAWNEVGVDSVAGVSFPTVRSDDWRLAYNFMAGASIPVSSGARVSAMYRWLHEDIDIACPSGVKCGGGASSQGVDLGLEFDL